MAQALAAAFLAGSWDAEGLLDRGVATFDVLPEWLPWLLAIALSTYRERPADRPRELASLLDGALASFQTSGGLPPLPPIVRVSTYEPAMGPARWPVPPIASVGDLAAFLDLHPRELDWLADRRRWERSVTDERLRNYRYLWLPRRSGLPRLIEQPKRLLKATQRRVLRAILDAIPAHEAAHGFRRGHSPITHARRHTGRQVVLRFDLEDFFASVAAGRVYGIFRAAGYPESVAHALTALSTNVVPAAEWASAPRPRDPRHAAAHWRLGRRLATSHLPQGAPTSPALANLACYRLDCRLSELAARCGGSYSRYADDITISGDRWLIGHAANIRRTVAEIASESGFSLHLEKSQLMSRGGRQATCGIVVNDHPNVSRRDYDRLKAQLHDAARNGLDAANRTNVPDFSAHLAGRISWVEAVNPHRGAVLRRRFEALQE